MIEIRKKLLAVFQTEAKEHLGRIRALLPQDGAAGAVALPQAAIDEVFRRAHSLKGAARAVDLRVVENLSHALETLFARVREGAVKFDAPGLDVVRRALDQIEDGVAAQLSGQTPVDPAETVAAIERVLARAESSASGTAEGPKSSPPTEPKAPEKAVEIRAEPAAPAASRSIAAHDLETLRVSSAIVERLHRSAGQLTTERMRQDLAVEQAATLGKQIAEISREWEQVRKSSSAALRRLDANPETARLARYINFVERQVAALARNARDLALLQRRSAWSLRNIGEQLQQDVCGARMVVAEQVFDNFGKMLRDLARDEGKEIDFRAAGMDVQADRQVLQALKDPLMHLLRNSLAHGIEKPDERERAGKKRAGAVSLRLEARGNRLAMTVEDDGRGIDVARVGQAAVAKRVVTEAALAAMNAREQARLIFHPGISTSRAVTELSGRGMGLNIVADAVGKLQGTVDVQPNPKGGTTFVVSVPLAVSSHRLVLVKCGGQKYALAAHAIEGLHRIKLAAIVSLEARPVVGVHGAFLPLASLADILLSRDEGVVTELDTVPVAVLKSGERRVAFAVDAFVCEMEGVIKDLSPLVTKSGKFAGAILLGDGSVVLVLDAAELIETFLRSAQKQRLKTSAPTPEKRTPTILVVDDSMTTRTLEKSILEAHGYLVRVAVDGIEALTLLRSEQVDLVVSDVEMPRLDGFGLLQELKKDAQLAKIPILLVTSLEKREDKERGLALGADGYIVKRKFDQKILLDTVRQML